MCIDHRFCTINIVSYEIIPFVGLRLWPLGRPCPVAIPAATVVSPGLALSRGPPVCGGVPDGGWVSGEGHGPLPSATWIPRCLCLHARALEARLKDYVSDGMNPASDFPA